MSATRITSYTINPLDVDNSVLSWTGTAGAYVHLAINGYEYVTGAIISTASKSITIPYSINDAVTIDLTEETTSTYVPPAHPITERRPYIKWSESKATSTIKYYIYIDGYLKEKETHIPDKKYYSKQLREELTRGWHKIEVKAVDQYNQLSTTEIGYYYTHDVVPVPATSITGTTLILA